MKPTTERIKRAFIAFLFISALQLFARVDAFLV
jgi:hypothetical protein